MNNFLIENELDWSNYKSVCTDGAASITGRVKGLMARIRNKHPEVQCGITVSYTGKHWHPKI